MLTDDVLNLLRAAMRSRGFSQARVGRTLDLAPGNVWRILRRNPMLSSVIRVAGAARLRMVVIFECEVCNRRWSVCDCSRAELERGTRVGAAGLAKLGN